MVPRTRRRRPARARRFALWLCAFSPVYLSMRPLPPPSTIISDTEVLSLEVLVLRDARSAHVPSRKLRPPHILIRVTDGRCGLAGALSPSLSSSASTRAAAGADALRCEANSPAEPGPEVPRKSLLTLTGLRKPMREVGLRLERVGERRMRRWILAIVLVRRKIVLGEVGAPLNRSPNHGGATEGRPSAGTSTDSALPFASCSLALEGSASVPLDLQLANLCICNGGGGGGGEVRAGPLRQRGARV